MKRLLVALVLALALASTRTAAEPERGVLIEHVAATADPSQTYTLYLPASYDATKAYPVLFILDPRGRSKLAAEIFRPAAEQYGWILVSSNDTRSDVTDTDPNARALNAIVPDALRRTSIDPRRVYFAGFSGTAMLSWAYAMKTGRVAGVIAVGGRLVNELPPAQFTFAWYGASGTTDFNNREMRQIDAILDLESSQPHRFDSFEGAHQWFPPAHAFDALAWMELIAMKQRLRPRDEALIARLAADDLAAAKELEVSDRLLALRRYRAIERTYEGLASLDAVRPAITRLSAEKSVRQEEKDEAEWDAFEVRYLQDVHPRAATFLQQKNVSEGFRIPELKRRAKKLGPEGRTAQRLLEGAFAQLANYLPAQLFAAKRYDQAVLALTSAIEIHPDRWPLWYNLGAAHALRHDKRHALEALSKAVSLGFKDRQALLNDADYAFLRDDKTFRALVEGLPPP